MTYLPIITLAPSPIPSQIPHTLFDIISLGVDAVLCHDQDTCKTIQWTYITDTERTLSIQQAHLQYRTWIFEWELECFRIQYDERDSFSVSWNCSRLSMVRLCCTYLRSVTGTSRRFWPAKAPLTNKIRHCNSRHHMEANTWVKCRLGKFVKITVSNETKLIRTHLSAKWIC